MNTRWWQIVVGGALVLVAGLVSITATAVPWSTPVALGLIVVFALFFFTVGKRGLTEPRWAAPLLTAVFALTAVGTALSPNMAVLQAIAYPMIWVVVSDRPLVRPILLNALLAALVALGFYLCFGGGFDALMQAVVIEGISLGLGVGIGVWFSLEMRKSEEKSQLLAELTDAQGQLALLHHEAGAGAERERLALELHDTIAQNLTSVVMLAQRALNRGDDLGAVRDDLGLIEEVARDALTETRVLVAATAPVAVEGGLTHALQRLTRSFERETGILIATDLDDVGAVPRDLQVVLLRCAQEALANVRKHSRATHARLALRRPVHGEGEVELVVSDDGVGISDAAADRGDVGGFGLDGMRQRLAMVSGGLRVAALAHGGTELVATVRTDAARTTADDHGATDSTRAGSTVAGSARTDRTRADHAGTDSTRAGHAATDRTDEG
ncbi:histidine kinase [Herbiconiux sp. KACC 21604]|uniref:sensor histidine kinase n=1 Tax=unclassified Herbiconiux TaxID=2618217 RepID=UPI001492573C|nr:histidine kinase [Herbiconiux sp. SALV-R1]QJU54699.1 sensor histidine kinase [Herbiconiux sp. SALV-R1]WPO85803.1 histidine kinase [Herbiconiux sp. KACC 21604]